MLLFSVDFNISSWIADVLQLIYDVHDFISKYVQKILGEGE
jgi:hypothetical protein